MDCKEFREKRKKHRINWFRKNLKNSPQIGHIWSLWESFDFCETDLTTYLDYNGNKGFQFYLRKECNLLLESVERTKESTIKRWNLYLLQWETEQDKLIFDWG